MVRLKHTDLHVTISQKNYDESIEPLLIEYLKGPKSKTVLRVSMVRELGHEGGHPHLHVAIQYSKQKLAETLRKQINDLRGIIPYTKKELWITKVDDFYMLVGGYHTKESTAKKIYEYNIDAEEAEVGRRRHTQRSLESKEINYRSGHHTIRRYIVDRKLIIKDKRDFVDVLLKMLKDGYNTNVLLGKTLHVYSAYLGAYTQNVSEIRKRWFNDMAITENKEDKDLQPPIY